MSLATNTLKADWSDLKEYAFLMKVHVFYYFKNFWTDSWAKKVDYYCFEVH